MVTGTVSLAPASASFVRYASSLPKSTLVALAMSAAIAFFVTFESPGERKRAFWLLTHRPNAEAKSLMARADRLSIVGRYEQAGATLEEARALYHGAEDPLGEATAALGRGGYNLARSHYTTSRELYRGLTRSS